MTLFNEFYELEEASDELNERRGRVSKDPHHDDNVKFITKYYKREFKTPQRTAAINATKSKFMKAILAHDKELLKQLKDDSLESYYDLINKNNINLKVKRVKNWEKQENDIVAGLNKLFKDKAFIVVLLDGRKMPLSDNVVIATKAGGGRQSDIKVMMRRYPERRFFIESKLNFLTAQYFKFGLDIVGQKIKYDHSFFIQSDMSTEEKSRIDNLFKNNIDLNKFLNDLLNSKEIKQYWSTLLKRMDAVQKYIIEDKDFGQFAKSIDFNKSFIHDANLLVKVFDTYCNHYIQKYNSLVEQILDTYEGKDFLDDVSQYYIEDHAERADYSDVFWQIDYMMDLFDSWNEIRDDLEGLPPLKIDRDKMIALSDELKTIEVKLDRIMKAANVKDPRKLLKLESTEKLKYFFAAFMSTTGRKEDGKNPLLGNSLFEDGLGNMVLCPEINVKSDVLAQMITDFYTKKDNCHYIQIGDTVYALKDGKDLFKLKNLPVFNECIVDFKINLKVKDDLSKICLDVRAVEPDAAKLKGHEIVSFKANDANYIGKLMRGHEIVLQKKAQK